MTVLMPKLDGRDPESLAKWAERVIAAFERGELDTVSEEVAATSASPSGTMAFWLAGAGAQSVYMSGASAPAPNVASASSEFAGYPAWEAFDGVVNNINDGWFSANATMPQWLNRKWTATPQTWTSYKIINLPYAGVDAAEAWAPRDWELQGSNDNWASHTVLDTRTGVSSWSTLGNDEKAYDIAAPGSYEDYRLHITANNGSTTGVGFAELVFYSRPAAPDGWVWADGSILAQNAYPDLYAVVGDKWNTGSEGAGNFRLPDATDTVDGVLLRRIIKT